VARIYSTRIAEVTIGAGGSYVVDVADGDTMVVRDIQVYPGPLDAGGGNLTVGTDALQWVSFWWPTGFIKSLYWNGRQVVPGGSALVIQAFSDGTIGPVVAVSGYVLTP